MFSSRYETAGFGILVPFSLGLRSGGVSVSAWSLSHWDALKEGIRQLAFSVPGSSSAGCRAGLWSSQMLGPQCQSSSAAVSA